MAAFARPSRWRRLVAQPLPVRTVCAWALTLGAIAVVAWMIVRVLPVLTVREALLASQRAVIAAGPRDDSFFREGWSDPVKTYNVTARVARGERSVVDIPLPRSADYHITVRLDPFPPPTGGVDDLPSVRVFFNGVFLRAIRLTWNPERVGSYDFIVRKALVSQGLHRLVFVGDHGSGEEAAADGRRPGRSFNLWYVLVEPTPGVIDR
jgi:hypothetical protein